MANRELLAERVSSAAVSSGGTGSPTLYDPVYITLTWVHNEILPAGLLKGFRVVLFLGTNPNDTSQYLVQPREFPASDRSCVMMVRVDTSLQINAAIQSLYTDGNESSWRQLSGTVTVDPDTKLLADKAGLDATSATANSALQMAYAAADDGILSRGEKPNIIVLFNSAQADYTSLSTQAQGAGVDYSVLSEAWSTLNAVVTSLTPTYTDTTADTPLPNSTEWNATWTAWNSAKTSTLIKLLTAPPNSINAVMASNVANLTTNATQPTIDGVLQAAGNKLLLIGQTTKSQNGYYEVGYTPSQGAAHNIWPTAYTESSTGCVDNPVNAYDNSGSPDYTPNNSTSANLDSSFFIRNIKYHTFPGSTNINGTLHIVVTPECNYDTRGGSSSVIVDISTDGGTTWTTVASYDPETTTQQDIQYSLVGVAPQNVKVMVRAIGHRVAEWDPDFERTIYVTTSAYADIASVYIYVAAVGSANWFYIKKNDIKDKSIWRVSSGVTYGGKSYIANVATDNGITLSQTVAAYEAPLGLPSQNAQVLCSDTNGVRYWATVSGGGGGAWGSITGTLANQTDLQNALNAKEGSISAGTAAQYWRGDKTWATMPTSLPASDVYAWAKANVKPTYTKSEVGLGNVDNTADANKSVSNADTVDGWHASSLAMRLSWTSYTYEANIDLNGLTITNEPRFLQPTGRTNAPSGTTDMGYTWMPAGGDTADRGVQFFAQPNGMWWRERSNNTWREFITSTNIGSQSVSYATTAGSAPASDVYAWAKASTKPTYTYTEVGAAASSHTHGSYSSYDINFSCNSKPAASQKVLIFKCTRAFTLLDTGHQMVVYTNPTTSSAVLTVKKNGSSIGTITVTTAGAITFSITQTSFGQGDILIVEAPSSQNSTFADFGVTLYGVVS